MKQQDFKPDTNIQVAIDRYTPEFKPFFETRVMGKIAQLTEQSYALLFNRAFRHLLLSGVAAVAILLIAIFISDGTFSTDALMGTSNLNLENLTAMTIIGQ